MATRHSVQRLTTEEKTFIALEAVINGSWKRQWATEPITSYLIDLISQLLWKKSSRYLVAYIRWPAERDRHMRSTKRDLFAASKE